MKKLNLRINLIQVILLFFLLTIITCHYNKYYNNQRYDKYARNRQWKQKGPDKYQRDTKKQTKYEYKPTYDYQNKNRKFQNVKKTVNQKIQVPAKVNQKKINTINLPKIQKQKMKTTQIKSTPKIIHVQQTITQTPNKQQIIKMIEQKLPNIQELKLIYTPSINIVEPITPITIQDLVPQHKPSQTITQTVEIKPVCDQRPIYDYNLLVLTWVPQSCYTDKDCQKDWQTYDDLRSPTIHAFRPYGSSSYYEACFGQKGDPHCQHNAYMANFQIDEALWNVTGLLYEISQYWPAQKFTHEQQQFYSHQWTMHGTCYLMNMIQDNQNAFKNDKIGFNRTVMIQYFRTAIKKFKQLAIDVEPGTQYTQKQQFASDIGFRGKQTHFVLICNKNNQIVEIVFCFNRSKLPGKQVTIPCTLDDTCDQNKGFRLKKPF